MNLPSTPSPTPASTPVPASRLLSRPGWIALLGLAALFILLFRHAIERIIFIAVGSGDWGQILRFNFDINGDWSHALLIPLISAYFIYQHRQRLAQATARLCWPGLLLFFLGLLSYTFWIGPGRNDMFQAYSMIVALLGLVLFVLGPRPMTVLWFPILYLVLAVKISQRPWESLSTQLRFIAARAGATLINLLGLPFDIHAELQGSTIDLWVGMKHLTPPMEVEDACSGLRMLMAFIALGVAIAYLFKRTWWQRLIMLAMTVPIAILVNVGRIVVLAFIRAKGNPAAAEGEFHIFIGMLMLIPAALLCMLLGWVLDKMVVEDDAPGSTPGSTPTPAPVTRLAPAPAPVIAPILRQFLGGAGVTALIGLGLLLGLGMVRPDLAYDKPFDWLPQSVHASLHPFMSSAMGHGLAVILLTAALLTIGWLLWRTQQNVATWRSHGSMGTLLPAAFAAGILVVAAAGMWSVIRLSDAVIFKLPVPLRHPLYTLPDQLGDWVRIPDPRFEEMSPDMIKSLGTDQFIRYRYHLLGAPEGAAGSDLVLHIAYYTGTVDTVPHVPERCFVAGGLTGLAKHGVNIEFTGDNYSLADDGVWTAQREREPRLVRFPARQADATLFKFGSRDNNQNASNVIYFFAANGKFFATPDAVRLNGFNIRDKYSYYCKVEVMLPGVGDEDVARRDIEKFLAAAMPEILACLPDWMDVQTGRWPVLTPTPTAKSGH